MIGIYCFTSPSGKKYIGQSRDIFKRKTSHKSDWNTGHGGCLYLHRAFDKYGFDQFGFEVLEECSIEELNSREQFWIQNLKTNDKNFGYNLTCGGDSLPNTTGENNPRASLTNEEIISIRKRFGKEKREDVYLDFSFIPSSTFNKIWNNQTWKSVGQEFYTAEALAANKAKGTVRGRFSKPEVFTILGLIDEGKGNYVIARQIKCSPNTVLQLRNGKTYQEWRGEYYETGKS